MKKINNNATPEIIISIKSKLPQMSPAMQKLARFIIDNPGSMDGIQIHQLSKESGVSEATITRFVKEIGYSNYQSFIIQMAKVNTNLNSAQFNYGSIKETDDVDTICQKVFAVNIQTITDTLSILDRKNLQMAADIIAEGKQIIIFAQGRSGVTASSLRQRLRRLGLYPNLYVDAHEGAIASSLAGKGDVVIGISTYGRSRMVISNLKRARANGAKTIVVTSYENIPLEEYADIVLRTVNNENLTLGYEPSCATVTQIIMLDCLYILLYMRDKEKADHSIEASIQSVEEEKV